MNMEDRLHRVLQQEAGAVDVDPRAWALVQQRVQRRRTLRTTGLAALAAAMVAAVVGIGVLVLGDRGDRVQVGPADTTTTTETTASTTTTTAPAPDEGVFPGIWPFTSREEVAAYEADPGVGMFNDAEATALEFTREYLNFPDPKRVSKESTDEGEAITVIPKPRSPLRTTIEVREVGDGDGPYVVTGAATKNIKVDQPKPRDAVGNPVTVSGTSTAYEATVYVQVRQDGGKKLGEGFVMGGANGEFGPFKGEIPYSDASKPAGAIVFLTESAEDGTTSEASVVRVAFKPAGTTRFSVFFHRDEQLVEIQRETNRTAGVLRAALESLFAGPRPEDGAGLSSPFSSASADLLADVNLRSDGTAVIELGGRVENANTSAGSKALLEELNATAFQFPTVKRIEYRLQGSCDEFWRWLQYGDCRLVDR